MAARIDLSSQVFNEKVVDKPPVPVRPTSGKFLNRGKLFPSTCQNIHFRNETAIENAGIRENAKNTCQELVLHHSAVKDLEDSELSKSKAKKVPNYCKRTQSAKARQRSKPAVPVSRRVRPQSAGDLDRLRKSGNKSSLRNTVSVNIDDNNQVAVIDLADNITPALFDIQREQLLALPDSRNYNNNAPENKHMSFTRPSLAGYSHEHTEQCGCRSNILSKEVEQRLKPSIYGLQRQRHVFGSSPDLTSDNLECFPYKADKTENKRHADGSDDEKHGHDIRTIPETLEPLRPWLTHNVPQDVIGVDPTQCLVFLPSMGDYSSLPEVPEPHNCEADLPYFKDVTTPKAWNPKKYPHPFNKQPVEEWVCKHSTHTATEHEKLKWTTLYRNFKLPRMRTAEVIQKEINDLENLLKGVGTHQSDCGMVRYQDDLTTLQDMLQVTMDKIPERLKTPTPEPPDTFGLNKVFADHDSVIQEIQARMSECRLELAELELEAGIDTDRQYFRKRSNSTL